LAYLKKELNTLKYQEIIHFWFEEIDKASWWAKDQDFDRLIKNRFEQVYRRAACCELAEWRQTAEGRLAEIIVLDQFPRNMYRDSAQAFATDPLALALAQEGIFCGADSELPAPEKSFFYMPFMHSESLHIHRQAVDLFSQPGLESNLDFELRHKKILEQFGRYPHRNKILNRSSTRAELEFLQQPGSSF